MFLTKLKVKNFLSVNGECELPIDPRVTVLLGANDHGKSNLLRALEHLNFDAPLRVDDENWDSKGVGFCLSDDRSRTDSASRDPGCFSDEYTRLLEEEREELATKAGAEAGNHAGLDDEPEEDTDDDESIPTQVARKATSLSMSVEAKIVQVPPPKVTAVLRTAPASAVDDDEDDGEDEDEVPVEQVTSAEFLEDLTFLKQVTQSPFLTLTRLGLDADLSVAGRSLTDLPEEILAIFREMTPRVELFKAFSGELQDSVNAGEIRTRESEFMQGIFFYAGLDPLNCSELFR